MGKSAIIRKYPSNPFVFGKMVPLDCFCNRKEEIARISQIIKDKYSLWLFSPRRYGKSSLVKKVFSLVESKDQKVLYLDLFNIKTLDDFCRNYSALISRELFDWRDDVRSITKKAGVYFKSLYPKITFDAQGTPSFSLDKMNIQTQEDIEKILLIPELIAKEKGIQICVAFDEFQEIKRIDPFVVNWMRSVFQGQQNISYIFLGSQQTLMENIFADINSPFYEFAVKMDIHPISHQDFYEFIKRKFSENDVHITKGTIESILNRSQLHPHFTQYFASVVYTAIINGADQNADDFELKWMEGIIDSQSIIFQEIFDTLNNNQRAVLLAIAGMQAEDELFSEKFRIRLKLPAPSSIRTVVQSLQKRKLIHKSEKRYYVSNPVMCEWLLLIR